MKLSEYIEVEKVTKDDILIFKIDIDMFDDGSIEENIIPIIREAKTLLDVKEIKSIFIPYRNGVEVEISNDLTESGLLELYNKYQRSEGFRDGYLKSLSDFDKHVEYDDNPESRNASYDKSYKLGYKTAWQYNTTWQHNVNKVKE